MTTKPAPAATTQPSDAKTPDDPTDVPRGGWWATFKRAFAEFRVDDMMTWAAALTYYAVLSLFPALIVLVSLIGVFGKQPDTTNSLLDIIGSIAPPATIDALRPMIENLVTNKSGAGALLSFGLVAAHLVGVRLHRRVLQVGQRDLRGRGGAPVLEAAPDPARR